MQDSPQIFQQNRKISFNGKITCNSIFKKNKVLFLYDKLQKKISEAYSSMALEKQNGKSASIKYFRIQFFGDALPKPLLNSIFIYRGDSISLNSQTGSKENDINIVKTYFQLKLLVHKFVEDEEELERMLTRNEQALTPCNFFVRFNVWFFFPKFRSKTKNITYTFC